MFTDEVSCIHETHKIYMKHKVCAFSLTCEGHLESKNVALIIAAHLQQSG